jgi:glycosyltransferase involved in cell wall biosynthesis
MSSRYSESVFSMDLPGLTDPLRIHDMDDDVVAFIGIGLFDAPTGITRAIQILADYFGHRGILVVDNLQALKTHRMRHVRLYTVRSPGMSKVQITRRLFSEPGKLFSDYFHMTVSLLRIFSHEKTDRVCCNTAIQSFLLSPLLILVRLLMKNVRITLLIYDPTEPAWCRKNLLVRLMLSSGFFADLVTVDTTMRFQLERLVGPTPVHDVRFGVSSHMIELAREDRNQIRDRIGSHLPETISRDKDSVILLFIGRVIARRRLEDLIVAFGKMRSNPVLKKRIVLYIGGYANDDLSYVKRLETLAVEKKCQNDIKFFGRLTPDELGYLYHTCDIFVFPAAQPWGLAPLEAMIFGKPIVITDECGLSEILQPKQLAAIARGRDPDDLAKEIERLVSDDAKRDILGKAGKAFIEREMTFRNTGEQLEEYWQNEK